MSNFFLLPAVIKFVDSSSNAFVSIDSERQIIPFIVFACQTVFICEQFFSIACHDKFMDLSVQNKKLDSTINEKFFVSC